MRDFDRMQSNQPWMNVMARIPSFEEILLEIYQSLGLERPQTKYIEQFADLGLPMGKHREMGGEMLRSILSALSGTGATSPISRTAAPSGGAVSA